MSKRYRPKTKFVWDQVDPPPGDSFYNWLTLQRVMVDRSRTITDAEADKLSFRCELMGDLITEIKFSNDGIVQLYASLLARTLMKTDDVLVWLYSKELSQLMPKEPRRNTQKQPVGYVPDDEPPPPRARPARR